LKNKSKRRKKVKLGRYPNVNVVLTMTFALLMLGAFGLLIVHAKKLEQVIKNQVEIQLFLKKDIPRNQIDQVRQILGGKKFILRKEGEAQISFLSKEDAAARFIKETGEDFMEFLGDNPLRDSYSIKVKEEYLEGENLKRIKLRLEEIPGVFEVSYTEDLISNVETNIQKAGIVLSAIFLIMLISSIMLINNSIKLALFSQRFLIRSMQLVGAKAVFIQIPYLRRATLQGIAAGILASGILALLLNTAYEKIEDLELLKDPQLIMWVFIILILVGMLIGFISSLRSIRKFLQLSLDELY
jgi:cell division transport system permease protein